MSAAELLTEYRDLREHWLDTGDGAYRARNTYERFVRQSFAEGRQPDSLERVTGPEDERFFAAIIQGPDGHVYWNGATRFRLDAGGSRLPRYWWYEHVHGKVGRGTVTSTCGELHCITPLHQVFTPWSLIKRRYTDEQMIGAIQVVAMRLGRVPVKYEYKTHSGRGPSMEAIIGRFGGWTKAVRAAGYEPRKVTARSPGQCIEALQFVAALLGRPPSDRDYRSCAAQLRESGLPSGVATIRHHLDPTWVGSLKKAGLL